MRYGLRHLIGACALALTFALAVPVTAAEARVSWVIEGRGYGHGVGMSQYGAYGYARAGKGYSWILRHYYRGTSVGTLGGATDPGGVGAGMRRAGRVVRVLLRIDPNDVIFGGASGACGRRLVPSRSYRAHRRGAAVQLRSVTGRLLAGCGRRLRATGGGRVLIGGLGSYRGALEALPTRSAAGSLNVINAVSVDRYVRGVVPREVPSSWPYAALRAQTVAARSFALSSGVGGNGFDLYADTRSQAYGGVAAETPRTNRAAADTRGEVVKYGSEIAQTFYFSTSGGRTESVENSFYGPSIPYLKSVVDRFDHHSPLHTWRLRLSGPEISARLGPYLKGKLRRIVIVERGDSPRIVWARLIGTRGTSGIRGDNLQYALGAYDRWMTFRKVVR
jgi:stage II sporulation protein D